MYNASECMLHASNCSLCKLTFGGVELCLTYNVSQKLPPREYGPTLHCSRAAHAHATLPGVLLRRRPTCPRPPSVAELHPQVPCPQPARLLQTEIFNCTSPPAPDHSLDSAMENHDACYVRDEATCSTAAGCVWCLASKAPSGCYFEDKARRLPASMFQCRFGTMLTSSRKLRLA